MKNFSKILKDCSNVIALSIIFCTVIVSTSCQKEEMIEPMPIHNIVNTGDYKVAVIDDRLFFEDSTSFANYQNWIFINYGKPELIESKNESIGFISMMSIYREGMNLDGNDPKFTIYLNQYPNVFHPVEFDNSIIYELEAPCVLAYIANKDGLYQIGDKICRVTFNHYYEIKNGDESKIPILFMPAEKVNDIAISVTNTKKNSNLKGQYSYRTAYFNSTNRIVARLYEDEIGYYWYFRARTTSQKKILGIWFRKKIDYVSLSWPSGYYYEQNNPYKYDIPASIKYNDSNIEDPFVISEGRVDRSKSVCTITHEGKRDGTIKNIVNYEF